jgi:hypothetical protein
LRQSPSPPLFMTRMSPALMPKNGHRVKESVPISTLRSSRSSNPRNRRTFHSGWRKNDMKRDEQVAESAARRNLQ